MRVATGKHVDWIDDEAVVYDSESGRLHYLNPTAALFFALIDESGFDEGLARFRERFGEQPDFDEHLKQLLDHMVHEGLLEDD